MDEFEEDNPTNIKCRALTVVSVLNITRVQHSDAGNYTCTANNEVEETVSQPLQLFIFGRQIKPCILLN